MIDYTLLILAFYSLVLLIVTPAHVQNSSNGISSNSTDGRKCVDYTCQVQTGVSRSMDYSLLERLYSNSPGRKMTAILTCDKCNEKASMKAYLPSESITFFPTTYWMLDKPWYSTANIDICPRCFELYKQEIQNAERGFMRKQPDLRDVEHI